MAVVAGRVHKGRVVLDEPLPEGAEVTVVCAGDDQYAGPDEAQIDELARRLGSVKRGAKLVPAREVMAKLRRRA
jgi:hypothetical protein